MSSVFRILFGGTSGVFVCNFCIVCVFEPGTSGIGSSCAAHSAATFGNICQ
jgi:hypothetical protein